MCGENLLHAAGRQSVAGDVDDVVDAAHHVDRSRLRRRLPPVPREVVTGEKAARYVLTKPVIVLPERGQRAWGSGRRKASTPSAGGARGSPATSSTTRSKPGTGLVGAQPGFVGKIFLALGSSAADRPAGLGLPPVIDHGDAEDVAPLPTVGLGIEALSGEVQRFQGSSRRTARRGHRRGPRVGMARIAVGAVNSTLTRCSLHNTPEGARVGRAHRLPLVHHRGGTPASSGP